MKINNILFFLFLFVNSHMFSQNIFKKNIEKDVKKVDEIPKKTKGCNIYDGLFTIYQSNLQGGPLWRL